MSGGVRLKKEFDVDYDGETKNFEAECKSFMEKFVKEVFNGSNIRQDDKARFGLLVQHQEGRDWFRRFVDSQRVNNKEVDEFTFFGLVQYFATCLFECNLADDFEPATSIMNMCFTYYFVSNNVVGRRGQPSKQFVYQYLKEQPIWKSRRFWNAAFLVAIHVDRTKRTVGMSGWNSWNNDQKKDFEIGEENSTFAHLASFLYMMKSFDISKDERDDFLQKMSTIGNLRKEQIQELEESVEILN